MASVAAQYAMEHPSATGHAFMIPTSIGCACLYTLISIILTIVYRKKAKQQGKNKGLKTAVIVFWALCIICACCASLNAVMALRSL